VVYPSQAYTELQGRVYAVSEEQSIERLSVAEAARVLGVTRDAIHKRISRGSIEHEKGEDGRFYVYVDTSTLELDMSTDMSKDESKVEALERLLENQQDRISFLERELERRGDETERLHQIVAGLTRATAELSARLPELEAPSEPPGAPETATGEPEEGPAEAPRPSSGKAQESVERRSWWRRMFGG
jgi:DNA-binding transcriptional MerR regulator